MWCSHFIENCHVHNHIYEWSRARFVSYLAVLMMRPMLPVLRSPIYIYVHVLIACRIQAHLFLLLLFVVSALWRLSHVTTNVCVCMLETVRRMGSQPIKSTGTQTKSIHTIWFFRSRYCYYHDNFLFVIIFALILVKTAHKNYQTLTSCCRPTDDALHLSLFSFFYFPAFIKCYICNF